MILNNENRDKISEMGGIFDETGIDGINEMKIEEEGTEQWK